MLAIVSNLWQYPSCSLKAVGYIMKKIDLLAWRDYVRKNGVKIDGNIGFFIYNIVLTIMFLGATVFSIIDKLHAVLTWPEEYSNVIGVASQVVTAIIVLVVSIIGIAISLQSEAFFGVEVTKLYALRSAKHYSILAIIVIAVFLSVCNLLFYMCGLTFASIGIFVVAILFLIKVVYDEVPIMAKEEVALLNILKNYLVMCYLQKKEASRDFKEAVRYLLYRKNLKELYAVLKDAEDNAYNQFLLFKLLEIQRDLAFDLKNNYEQSDQHIIASCLLNNVLDVVHRHMDLTEEMYAEVYNNRYLLTHVLFRLNELPASKEIFLHGVTRLFYNLAPESQDAARQKLASSIILVLIFGTVKKKDFEAIKMIRRELSAFCWGLRQPSAELDVFAVISLFLYYLHTLETDTPQDLKEAIIDFINEDNIIEEDTRIISWKKLFAEASAEFRVNYHNFLSLAIEHEHNMDYWLNGGKGKFVVLEPFLFTKWYLTNLLNVAYPRDFDYSVFVEETDEIAEYLKAFGDSCFDENKAFTPTNDMLQIINFYSDSDQAFVFFKIDEERKHAFFEFVNKIKVDELKGNSSRAAAIDTNDFSEKIRSNLETKLRSEWGYDSTIAITAPARYFAVLLELYPEAINFEDSILEYCERNLFADIEKSIKKTTIYKSDSFENRIDSMLQKELKYTTEKAALIFTDRLINDKTIKENFVRTCNSLEEIQSRLLGAISIVTNGGFRFNCKIEKVDFRKLSEEELSDIVSEYQRADGQHIFRGVFLPKEEITRIIRDKFVVLTIVVSHQVISSEESVYELKPYSSEA